MGRLHREQKRALEVWCLGIGIPGQEITSSVRKSYGKVHGGSSPPHTTKLLILNVINMVKLKRLSVEKIDPSINRKGQVEFLFHDCYLRKDQIGGVIMINDEHSINNNWADKEVKNYCKNNNLRLCTILTIGNMPDCNNVVVDETVKDLIKYL
jgi:hypothetical protein